MDTVAKIKLSMDDFMVANIDLLREMFKDKRMWDTKELEEVFNGSGGLWIREIDICTMDVAISVFRESNKKYNDTFVTQIWSSEDEDCDTDVYMYDDGVNEEVMVDVNPITLEYSKYS